MVNKQKQKKERQVSMSLDTATTERAEVEQEIIESLERSQLLVK